MRVDIKKLIMGHGLPSAIQRNSFQRSHYQACPMTDLTVYFFLEPHGLVEFYVYSPQWGGIASDVNLMPTQEELISKSEEKTKSHKVLWITLAAKDGSYLRSIEEKRSMDGSSVTVFSIKYRDAKALSAFRNAYQDFKQSLTQSAD